MQRCEITILDQVTSEIEVKKVNKRVEIMIDQLPVELKEAIFELLIREEGLKQTLRYRRVCKTIRFAIDGMRVSLVKNFFALSTLSEFLSSKYEESADGEPKHHVDCLPSRCAERRKEIGSSAAQTAAGQPVEVNAEHCFPLRILSEMLAMKTNRIPLGLLVQMVGEFSECIQFVNDLRICRFSEIAPELYQDENGTAYLSYKTLKPDWKEICLEKLFKLLYGLPAH